MRESIFSQIDHLSRSVFCFFSSRKEIVPLLFFLEEKNGRLAREAQALRRTDAGTSCVVVGRNTTAGMPPSSAVSLPVSAAPARQLSRASRPRKRKSSAEQLLSAAVAFFTNVLHKTDGSHTNRPFFSFRAGRAGKHLFTDKSTAPQCLLFLFFKKRNRPPLLFFLEEKKTSPLPFLFMPTSRAKRTATCKPCVSVVVAFSPKKAEKSECVPRAAGSPPPTVGGPRRMQRRVQRSSASCTGRSPYRACPV